MALNILVTGANGFIGSHVCEALNQAGHHVKKAVRDGKCLLNDKDCAEVGDIHGTTDWSAQLDGVDVVVHTAARVHVLYESVTDPMSEFRHVNVEGTLQLAKLAVAAGVKRLIFISTIGVLGNYSEKPFSESNEPSPSNAYSASKWEAEQQLMQLAKNTSLEVVIIRPPLVYGAGVKANFYRLMHCVAQGKPLPFGSVKNARDFVSVKNLCSLILTCLDHPAAKNETFLAADGEAISTPDLVRKLSDYLEKPSRLIPVPTTLLHLGAIILQKERLYHSVCASLRIEISKAQKLLGWQPVQTLDEGLKDTVTWYHKDIASPEHHSEQERIAA